jgi:methylenetetrahydrofolate reductase (NADPH)
MFPSTSSSQPDPPADPVVRSPQVNKQGDLRTNASAGPNAVTWGVFPGAEIIQPTVVDGMAFLVRFSHQFATIPRRRAYMFSIRSQAWKDEAFELGAAWAELYKSTAPESAKVIHEVMDTFYLGSSRPGHCVIPSSFAPAHHVSKRTVNVVQNDYRDTDDLAIFKPFFTLAASEKRSTLSSSSSSPKLNGTTNFKTNGTHP